MLCIETGEGAASPGQRGLRFDDPDSLSHGIFRRKTDNSAVARHGLWLERRRLPAERAPAAPSLLIPIEAAP